MKTDLTRLSLLNFVGALVCLVFVVIGQTATIPFLALILVHTIAASIIVSRGASKGTHKKLRRAIMADNPSLAWRTVGLSIVLPLGIGLLCFYAMNTGFDIALIVFLGASYLFQIVINFILMPYIQRHTLNTFD